MGITKATSVMPTIYSPLGKACAGMDLSAVHDILLKTGYKDDEGAENEVTNNQIYAASDLCHQFVMNFPHFPLPLCFIFLLDSIDNLFIKVYLLNCFLVVTPCSFHSDPCIAWLEERRNAVPHHLHLECEMCVYM
jgi:hypothetical protein